MKLTITTLILIEDTSDDLFSNGSICYHSFLEDPKKAQQEILDTINAVYKGIIQFDSIEEIEEYFSWVKLEIQVITLDTESNIIAIEITQ